MAMVERILTRDVFTPGRIPVVTYNPRDEHNLEGEIKSYLQNRGAALTVSGPTKSGKTVLVEKLLSRDDAVWINGAELSSADDLWNAIIDFLELYDQIELSGASQGSDTSSLNATVGMHGIAQVGGGVSRGTETTQEYRRRVKRPHSQVAQKALKDVDVPVIIDDFHYVDAGVKVDLTRIIKNLISDIAVVLIAVPQDAFDVVRAESDMLGRVWQLSVDPWTEEELGYIGQQGFDALSLADDSNAITKEFAKNSLGAPFLMQQLCLDLCNRSGIQEKAEEQFAFDLPGDITSFYRDVAKRWVPGIFDELQRGPRTKGQPRLSRELASEETTDIYGAILYGISKMGPVRQVATQELARQVSQHLIAAIPTQQIASALGQMRSIAHSGRGSSDAVLDYKNDTLYIADPFLSFYLRFGNWELPKPPTNSTHEIDR